MAYYILSTSNPESYNPRIYQGPEVTLMTWESWIDFLLPEAIAVALHDWNGYIGWDEIVDSYEKVLNKYGYRNVNLPKRNFSEYHSIDNSKQCLGFPPEMFEKVFERNKERRSALYDKHDLNDSREYGILGDSNEQ